MPETCTTAAGDSTGCKLGTLRTERGTWAQPLNCCRCCEQVKNVHEWRHGQSPGTVECVEAAVMSADVWC